MKKALKAFNRQANGEYATWIGMPEKRTYEIYKKELGANSNSEVHSLLQDDCCWIIADSYYKHPEGKAAFKWQNNKDTAGQIIKLHGISDVAEVEKMEWPNPDYIDFKAMREDILKNKDKTIMSGMWCPFFHDIADCFGMEDYFVNMLTEPEIVDAVTQKVVDYYVRASERFFEQCGDLTDVMFFGNDLGTQRGLMISKELLQRFIFPSMQRLINIGKKHEKIIMLHSCGGIADIIPDLIDMGVDVLHPLQAKAEGMQAKNLEQYKNDLCFVGGVDTQDLLMNKQPDDVRREVDRLKKIFGYNWVVSPSHEAILPNVPLKNIVAMVEEAKGIKLF